jgi:hypothetical protein
MIATDRGPRDAGGRRGPEGQADGNRPHDSTARTAPSGSPVEALLARLDGVRKSGRGWMARCPAHPDRHASLSIGEGTGGAALIHCHACCPVDAVLGAIGLTPSDLFPPRPGHCSDRKLSAEALAERRVWSIAALLPVLVEEVTVLKIAAADIIGARPISPEHYARLQLAEQRLEDALATLRPRLQEVLA